MKSPNVLGYLAAFTLGIICMGVFTMVLLRARNNGRANDPSLENTALEQEVAVPETSRPQTFQRLPRGPDAPRPEVFPSVEPPEPPHPEPEPAIAVPAPVTATVLTEVHPVVAPRQKSSHGFLVPDAGRVSGKITLRNEPPPERRIVLDPACSAKWERAKMPPFTRFYLTGKDRGLSDVVVSLFLEPQGGGGTSSRLPLKLAVRNCFFEPYISAVQTGQSLIVENLDNTAHSLRMTSSTNGEFNRPLLPGREAKFTFRHAEEVVRFKCDIHPWEFAYVSVFDNPFFTVSDRNGVFVIPDVPPGKYTLLATHRKAGTVRKEVMVDAHRNADVNFEFEAPLLETINNTR